MERDQALKFMNDLLKLMLQKNGSDLFITANFPPAIKIDGKIVPQSNQQLTHTHTAELARVIMSDRQAQEFEATKECNFAISPPGIAAPALHSAAPIPRDTWHRSALSLAFRIRRPDWSAATAAGTAPRTRRSRP